MHHLRTGTAIATAVTAAVMTALFAGPADAATLPTTVATSPSSTSTTSTSTAAPVAPAPTAPTARPTAGSTVAPSTRDASAGGTPSVAAQNAAGDHVMGSPSAQDGDLAASSGAQSGGSGLRLNSLAAASGPSSGYVRGFDISAWQSNSSINWSSAYAGGARFVYIKATEATTYTSSQFGSQWTSATNAGMYRGAYVFATPNTASGAATADHFAAHGGKWTADGRTLPPLLDIENNPYGATCYGLSQSAMVSWITAFSTEMVKLTGRTPAIYSNISWWKSCTGNSAAFSANPNMPAYWPSTNFSGPGTLGASWTSWNVWQWADAGAFPGDQDVFNGSLSGLQAYAGRATAPSTALGHVDFVRTSPGAVTVGGWAADRTSRTSTRVAVQVNGTSSTVTANTVRADIAAAYPALGAAHGFTTTLSAPSGKVQVCVSAYPVQGATTASLGCSTVTVASASPFGSFDSAVATPSGVTVGGWAIDRDTTSPISVQLAVDGTVVRTLRASDTRTDVARAYPASGAAHGFSATVAIPAGRHTLCVTGVNTGRGSNATIGACRSVRVAGSAPVGSLDVVTTAPRSVTVSGWALDGDRTAPITVHAYVDGVIHAVTANGSRTDIAREFPAYGSQHGYTATFAAGMGPHRVCVSGMNEGAGRTNTDFGCKTVTVANAAPIGKVDAVTVASRTVTVSGWALDPNTPASIQVHVYVDGAIHGLTAGVSRADIARAYPGYGSAHGYRASYAVAAGSHTVCVHGMDATGGPNALLACRTVTVPR